MHQEDFKEELSLELPKEETVTTEIIQNDSKDLGEFKMEEVRIESVDSNTVNMPELESDSKDKSRFSLEKIWLQIKNSFLYYTSCSTKTEPINNHPK
jgi:hypothetical protein